jgi:HrpA-like RNA helicase
VYELAEWGADAAALRWLDAPPAASLAQARELLRKLGAIDDRGRSTPHGRAMALLPVHPRPAHLLQWARERGAGRRAGQSRGTDAQAVYSRRRRTKRELRRVGVSTVSASSTSRTSATFATMSRARTRSFSPLTAPLI